MTDRGQYFHSLYAGRMVAISWLYGNGKESPSSQLLFLYPLGIQPDHYIMNLTKEQTYSLNQRDGYAIASNWISNPSNIIFFCLAWLGVISYSCTRLAQTLNENQLVSMSKQILSEFYTLKISEQSCVQSEQERWPGSILWKCPQRGGSGSRHSLF